MKPRERVNRIIAVGLSMGALLSGCASDTSDPATEKAAAAARLCAAQIELARSFDPARSVTTGRTVAVVIGDSYSQGTGTSNARQEGWATLLGQAEGWTTYVDGTGGTGFTSGGPCLDQQFPTRIAAASRRTPGVVVLQGGLNDTTADPTKLAGAVDEILARLVKIPRVIVVGPPAAPTVPGAAAVDRVLSVRTRAANREYVSTLDGQFPFLPDGLHLTVDGYRDFAALVTGRISARR